MPDPIQHTKKRFRRWSIVIIAAALFGALGLVWMSNCHPQKHYSEEQLAPFLTATELELFSVNPTQMDYGENPHAPDAPAPKPLKTPFGDFHSYPVLGSCKITMPAELEAVRKAVRSLDAAGRDWGGAIAFCFNPRHGLRVRTHGMTCDLLICYECSQVQIYRGETSEGDIYFASTHATSQPTPEGLNGLLTSHAIALPREPKR